MDNEIRGLVGSEWAVRLGVSPSVLHTNGVIAVTAELGANAAMSFLFDERCIVVVGPDELDAAVDAVSGLDAREAFREGLLRFLVGPDTQVDGPSWHSYVNRRGFSGAPDAAVDVVNGTNESLNNFLAGCEAADVDESGFSPKAMSDKGTGITTFWVLREGDRVVAAGTMSDWRGYAADVGVLTHPDYRGRGFAGRLVAAMVDASLPTAGVVRYRALTSNGASLRVARRLGFEPFGQNYRARRPL